MLLIDSASFNQDKRESVNEVVVISENEGDLHHLAEALRSSGINYVNTIQSSFFDSNVSIKESEVAGVVVDIGAETDVDKVSRRILAIIPQGVWCCVVGRCDSLSIVQQFLAKNVFYFHIDLQLNLMIKRILAGKLSVKSTRNTVNVCVMGCKGGIGGTLIASQLALNIANEKNVPVLLAQGSNGSQDLDLLFNKKLSVDIEDYSDRLGLFMGDYDQIPESKLHNFNFVIYDKPISNVKKQELNHLFEISSNFVLVIERHPNSLRVARRFLEACSKQIDINKRPIRTFICINDSRKEFIGLISKSDLESLLGASVDATFPYLKTLASQTIDSLQLPKHHKESIDNLRRLVTGEKQRTMIKESIGLKGLVKKIVT